MVWGTNGMMVQCTSLRIIQDCQQAFMAEGVSTESQRMHKQDV